MQRIYGVPLGFALAFSVFGTSVNGQAPLAGNPSPDQVPLDPTTIPKFAHELAIPRVFVPTQIRDSRGRVIRNEYTVSVAHTQVQMLPPGYPMTTVRAFGGQVKIPGSSQTQFFRSSPGPVFENIRGIPTLLKWRDALLEPSFMPVDPTLHWANPTTMEPPTPPFAAFPPGYQDAQFPVPHVTHTHGLVVKPEMDGTAEEWFTPFQHRGPAFRTRDYFMPNEQSATQLFYHDHVMGVTRLGVYAGSVGAAYFIRDPNNEPLDRASSPLPKGEFEIPLIVANRSFFTDGELDFPRAADDPPPDMAYFQAEDGANATLVNGKVWPNLNVKRQQYRFRLLAADNTRVYIFQFDNNGTFVPFKIIGSDGGYLPAPQVVDQVRLGITERADILVDFSQFAPGTQIIMRNNTPGITADTTGVVMRFTVQKSQAVSPPHLSANLFPRRAVLVADAPARIKTLIRFRTRGENNRMRSLDGLKFSAPPTEFPLVGSTEEWVLVNTAEEEEAEEGEEPDADLGFHQIHLHLIEFQVVSRTPFDRTAYLQHWNRLNGERPVTRQIVLDPTPFYTGATEPPEPYETGWKDTVQTPPAVVTRIIARWAPQETPGGGVSPGENQFPFDPTVFPNDSFAQQGYVWHCHILGHEDNDMMRQLPLVNIWKPGKDYKTGNVIAYNNVNYRARVPHDSSQAPNTRFDRWERVNNNDGSWRSQIIYAVNDRVLHQGQLFRALRVHQARSGQTPPGNPALWEPIPTSACAQLVKFCADDQANPRGAACYATGLAGDEAVCLGGPDGTDGEALMQCLSVCEPVHATPCSGLCNDPVAFSVPDGSTFQSGGLGNGATCHETTSELLSGACKDFAGGRKLTINGREIDCDSRESGFGYPLPPQRHEGYCIQTTAGEQRASFTAF
jgi:FtsP/CotA-like multicopper oxidase with cupredoxin domain